MASTAISYNRLLASSGFSSDYFANTTDPVRTRDRMRLDGALPGGALGLLPWNMQVQRDRTQSGNNITDGTALLSANVGSISLSNLLHAGISPGNRVMDGTFSTGSSFGSFRLRGQVAYGIRPEARLNALALSGDRTLDAGYLLNLSATRSFNNPELRLNLALNKSLGDYGLAFTGGYSNRGEYSVGVVLFIGMGRDPRTGRWKTSAMPTADTGAASALVYLDRNGNSRFDAGDEALRNVGFMVNGANLQGRTNEDGLVFLDRLAAWRNADITINRSTLEDPQWTPRVPGFRLTPRPGHVNSLDFPVVYTAEVDGVVQLQRDGSQRGVSNVLMELTDREDRVVARTRSEGTGYYHFAEVPPGRYRLRVSPSQTRQLGLLSTSPVELDIPATGDQLPAIDFLLKPDLAAPK